MKHVTIECDRTLRFWIDCEYEPPHSDVEPVSSEPRTAQILRLYEEMGYAMRHLDGNGQIAWVATPLMLSVLADLQRDAEDDFADVC
jgi:hypothetical protein